MDTLLMTPAGQNEIPEWYQRLEALLKARGRSKAALARALDMSTTTIQRWREGVEPTYNNMQRVAAFLGVSVTELVPDAPAGGDPYHERAAVLAREGATLSQSDLQTLRAETFELGDPGAWYWETRVALRRTAAVRMTPGGAVPEADGDEVLPSALTRPTKRRG